MEEKHGHGHGIIRGTIPDHSNSYATWKLKACALCYIKQILADLCHTDICAQFWFRVSKA